MSFLFDAVLILIFALTVFTSYKRGFVKSVMSLGSSIASVLAAYAFTPALADYLSRNFFLTKISGAIAETIKSIANENPDGTFDLLKLIEDMPEAFRELISRYNADISSFTEATVTSGEEVVMRLADTIASPVAGIISSVVAFIIIFVGSMLALTLITCLLDIIFRLPILKTANQVLGFAFGVVAAFVIVWTFSVLFTELIGALSSISPSLFGDDVVESSIILRLFSKYNLLGMIRTVLAIK